MSQGYIPQSTYKSSRRKSIDTIEEYSEVLRKESGNIKRRLSLQNKQWVAGRSEKGAEWKNAWTRSTFTEREHSMEERNRKGEGGSIVSLGKVGPLLERAVLRRSQQGVFSSQCTQSWECVDQGEGAWKWYHSNRYRLRCLSAVFSKEALK